MTLTTYYTPAWHTSATSRLIAPPSYMTIPSDPDAALAYAVYLDRLADLLLSEGRSIQAEAASHLALEVRARVLEMLA